jgi:peptidyl-prolyl cis-trans isomerase C
MYAMTRNPILAAMFATTIAASLAVTIAQAQTAAPKAAATTTAAAGKALYPQAQFDTMLKQRLQQGQPDTPELRNAIREELNTRVLLAKEASKQGLDKNADVKTQMDLASQTVLVSAFVADWIKKNPIPDAELRKEYDVIKAQIGDKEYHVKHILVEKEDDAKDIIVQLQKGGKFDELAKARSKDPGSKDKGGDLDWNAPAGFVKPFSDAMVATPKGKFTTQPVQTQFGYHVIFVEDIRDAKVPPFDEVKPQLQQRMQAAFLDKYFKELRAKNGV